MLRSSLLSLRSVLDRLLAIDSLVEYDSVAEIDFAARLDSFIVKPNHSSGWDRTWGDLWLLDTSATV